MAREVDALVPQNAMRNNFALIRLPENAPDGLQWWVEQYFQFEVTTRMVKKLMRLHVRSILEGPQAVRDTESGLHALCLG
jgi:hypothetical protein